MKRKAKTPITNIRSATGDKGTTWFRGNPIHPKSSDSIQYLSFLDLIQSKAWNFPSVQNLMFALGAHFNNPSASQYADEIESLSDAFEQTIKSKVADFLPLKGFVRSSKSNKDLMELRSIIRQAELLICRINEDNKEECNLIHMKSLNILSDFIFLLAWKKTVESGELNTWNGIEKGKSINNNYNKIIENEFNNT